MLNDSCATIVTLTILSRTSLASSRKDILLWNVYDPHTSPLKPRGEPVALDPHPRGLLAPSNYHVDLNSCSPRTLGRNNHIHPRPILLPKSYGAEKDVKYNMS